MMEIKQTKANGTWSKSSFLKNFFIYFCLCRVFIAVCGLSLVVASKGYSPAGVCGLLLVVASLVADWTLGHTGSAVALQGL